MTDVLQGAEIGAFRCLVHGEVSARAAITPSGQGAVDDLRGVAGVGMMDFGDFRGKKDLGIDQMDDDISMLAIYIYI